MKKFFFVLGLSVLTVSSFAQGIITISGLSSSPYSYWFAATNIVGAHYKGISGFGDTTTNFTFSTYGTTTLYLLTNALGTYSPSQDQLTQVGTVFNSGLTEPAGYSDTFNYSMGTFTEVPESSTNAFFFGGTDPNIIWTTAKTYFPVALTWVLGALATLVLIYWIRRSRLSKPDFYEEESRHMDAHDRATMKWYKKHGR